MERWKDCLAALVACYDGDGGNATLIFTDSGECFSDGRTVKWNLRRLARLFSVDVEGSRKNQGDYLHYSQGLPLPLSASLVLVPLKTRIAVGKNDGCHSYVNPAAVLDLAPSSGGDYRSTILLPGERLLPCCYSLKTVRKRLRDGAIALERHRSRLFHEPPGGGGPRISSHEYRLLLDNFIHALVAGVKSESGPAGGGRSE